MLGLSWMNKGLRKILCRLLVNKMLKRLIIFTIAIAIGGGVYFASVTVPKIQLKQQCLVQAGLAFALYIDEHSGFPSSWSDMFEAGILKQGDGDGPVYTRDGHEIRCFDDLVISWGYTPNGHSVQDGRLIDDKNDEPVYLIHLRNDESELETYTRMSVNLDKLLREQRPAD